MHCLMTKGVFGQPTCRKPLILCPTSLVDVRRRGGAALLQRARRTAATRSRRLPAAHVCTPRRRRRPQNWGKEFKRWLGDRVEPVIVNDTKVPAAVRPRLLSGRACRRAAACGCCHAAAVRPRPAAASEKWADLLDRPHPHPRPPRRCAHTRRPTR